MKKQKIDVVVNFAALKSVPESMSNPLKYYKNNINGYTVVDFLNTVKDQYEGKQVIHLILDQAGYNKSSELREHAFNLGIL